MLRSFGAAVLRVAPWLMKGLSVAGTAAMFLVGGGILTHGIPGVHSWIVDLTDGMADVRGIGRAVQWLASVLLDAVAGILAGALVLAVVSGARRVTRSKIGV